MSSGGEVFSVPRVVPLAEQEGHGPDDEQDEVRGDRHLQVQRPPHGPTAQPSTDRQIAGDLAVSDHTVARHLNNIFAKLGVSPRAAATAYAVTHELV